MTEWNTHEACPGSIEDEDRRTANKNYEGDDVLDGTGYGLWIGCWRVVWKCCSTLSAMLPSMCLLERPWSTAMGWKGSAKVIIEFE
jgi:hypothetical protein